MSGMDVRGHVREGSIARKRAGISSTAPPLSALNSTPSRSPQPPASPLKSYARPAASPRAEDSSGFMRENGFVVKLIAGLVTLLLLGYYGSGMLMERSVRAGGRERKHRLSGTAGEGWVLPRKWREYDAGSRDAQVAEGEVLPVCKRVLLHVFDDQASFASEINLYIRLAVLSTKLGYTLLPDTISWNHGSLQEYFLPKTIFCRPPVDWFYPSSATALGTKSWRSKDRLYVSRKMLNAVDEWIMEETLDPDAFNHLAKRNAGDGVGILGEGETVPDIFEDEFADFVAAARELLKPNDVLASLIRSQRMELGLGQGGTRSRKDSPTWGGNRRLGAGAQRESTEAVHDSGAEHDFDESGGAERVDRGPLIGVQGEVTTLSAHLMLQACNDAVRRLTRSTKSAPGYRRGSSLFPRSSKPTLISLLIDSTAITSLTTADPSAPSYAVLKTTPPTLDSLRPWSDSLHLNTGEGEGEKGIFDRSMGEFNRLPAGLRIHLTRFIVRDLFTLSLHADAFVVKGSTNTGQLALLLAGEDAVIGPRDITGRGLGGRVRSIDDYWRPTQRISALYR